MNQLFQTFKTFDGIKNWITLIASIFGVVAFFRTCNQESRIQSMQDIESAMQHRPTLEIVKHTFHINSCNKISFVGDPVFGYGVELEGVILQGVLYLHNSGHSYAKLVMILTCDSLIGKPLLRDEILKEPHLKKYINKEHQEFFSEKNIIPGATDSTDVFINVSNHDSSNGTLHILLVYENEIGALYDTYYWVKYNFSLPDTIIHSKRISNDTTYIGLPEKLVFRHFIRTEITNQDPKVYSDDELKLMKRFLVDMKSQVSK